MKILKIKCSKCSGPMWEEELPETPTLIDIVCIDCGKRLFYNKREYFAKKKEIEKYFGKV